MAQPYLSIVIPAYNEAEWLPLTLVDMDKRLGNEEYSYEILVVNDGSTDNTAEIVRNMQKLVKNLKLIDNSENKGKGSAVRYGMLVARGKIRIFTDADNSIPIDQVNKILPYFPIAGGLTREGDGKYDVVIGSRAVKGSRLEPPPPPLGRRVATKIGNLLIQLFILPGIKDTQCGFKAFTEGAAEKLFNSSRIPEWGFDIEILALAKALNYRIKEVPVSWSHVHHSSFPVSAYLKVLLETFKIRWWLWTGKYGIISK